MSKGKTLGQRYEAAKTIAEHLNSLKLEEPLKASAWKPKDPRDDQGPNRTPVRVYLTDGGDTQYGFIDVRPMHLAFDKLAVPGSLMELVEQEARSAW